METEQMAAVAGGTHTGDRGPYRTGHVYVKGVGVIDVTELMRQHAAMNQEVEDLRRTIVAIDSGWTPPPHVPAQQAEFVQAALEELNHARSKHGDGCIDGAKWSDSQRLSIILEELGEVAKELNDEALSPGVRQGVASTVEGGHVGRLLGEMVQVAAMAIGWGATLMPGQAAQMPAVPTCDDSTHNHTESSCQGLWGQPAGQK